ncbi:MAG: translation initiation factor IF-3 [Candidatus Omnitrophota bacterium]|nr:translation initiation factor IF-3 [Candidatus Omnitrophota bacterium]MDZ4242500.1 translation initiation factor IF-3 [Candidatus Omnitrophota bacterium]
MNERIRCPEVRVIGPNSEQLGVVVIKRALELAQEHELDLVEVAPMAKPPVCRIMDFSKYKYDQEKKERRVKKHQHVAHLKQIRIKPHIDEHDYQVKLRQAIGFLEKKDKVKINLFFRGREMAFRDLGQKVVDRFVVDLGEHGLPEGSPSFEGRVLSISITPRAEKGKVPDKEKADSVK